MTVREEHCCRQIRMTADQMREREREREKVPPCFTHTDTHIISTLLSSYFMLCIIAG